MDFENKIKRLEEIVAKMEDGEIALEESLKLFEEGVRLTKECQAQLSAAENKVRQLTGLNPDGSPNYKEISSEGE